MFSEDLYAGWVAEGEKMPLLERLRAGEKLEGRAEGVRHFWWERGGGECAEGTLRLYPW